MNTRREFLDDLWHRSAGKKYTPPKPMRVDSLRKSEWCDEFEQFMRNRLVMGAFRYGLIAEQNFDKYDLTEEIKKRVDRYSSDRNLEHLVDAANICLLAFVHGQRAGESMESIDDGEHTPEK